MPVRTLTLVAGALLVALAAAAAAISRSGSPTVWIPAFLGVPLLICGLVALKPAARAAAVHIALVLGLLGAVASLWKLIDTVGSDGGTALSTVSQLAMFVICTMYLVLGIRSFAAARRARKRAAA
ncbi:hypothetical protein [Phycisphaera mikurensis]|uniref:Uncharacterized protein n=1 Tax=Phycisphaera mikurensis (strain NBRC 102666 / KCTC 22515 / FYK2301M01) TaxID=1142394 RepID=I0IAK3_PHYMF|nr:hypothetical protein [Phycisphaera mikurensis]MBB6441713.1 apolipoprotein N-acyltransferase [Phycisphaera mikurensis]BAM02291.1 hypothetical protein PSMK_01320 [Phycisphaera mikurensis NBRC 102666]